MSADHIPPIEADTTFQGQSLTMDFMLHTSVPSGQINCVRYFPLKFIVYKEHTTDKWGIWIFAA